VLGAPKRRLGSLFLQEMELKKILTHSAIPSGSRRILDNVMDFSRSRVRDVMTPRARILAISNAERIEVIIEHVIRSGYSRLPIYEGSIDNIKGVLYAKDLLLAWRSGFMVLEDLLRPVYRVSADMPLPDLLRMFRGGKQHLAVVVSPDNGRLDGIVTIQDALEAIAGDIKEEP
jgi:CBS domain containing-hemolysin-like protein